MPGSRGGPDAASPSPWPAVALVLSSASPPPRRPRAAADAPGAPGQRRHLDGGRQGRRSAPRRRRRATRWLTLDDGELTEVYAPDLGTPSVRDLQFVVTDGKTFAEREREDATHRIELADPRSLTYRQVNTARSGRWRITKTYVDRPGPLGGARRRAFESLTGRPLRALRAARPGAVEHRRRRPRAQRTGATLVAYDGQLRRARSPPSPAPSQVSSGYLGASDGWTDLRADFRMDWAYDARAGRGQRRPDRAAAADRPRRPSATRRSRSASAPPPAAAAATATASLARRLRHARPSRYAAGWHAYLGGLTRPRSAAGPRARSTTSR